MKRMAVFHILSLKNILKTHISYIVVWHAELLLERRKSCTLAIIQLTRGTFSFQPPNQSHACLTQAVFPW